MIVFYQERIAALNSRELMTLLSRKGLRHA